MVIVKMTMGVILNGIPAKIGFLRPPALLSLAILAAPAPGPESSPVQRDARIRALRMDVFACGARLSWHTYGPTRSFVRYGKNFLRRTRPARKPRTWHEAELRGLRPGKSYRFRIIVRRASSTKYSLTYAIRTRRPRELRVPAQFNLKQALEKAGACDTVRVSPGTYTGAVKVPRGVRLIGAGYERTILDGKGAKRVVVLNDQSLIRGFTIRGSGGKHWDSGIWFTGSASPIIRANRIEKNSMGIAHYCWEACESGPRIEGNLIVNNAREGLHLEKAAAMVRNNTVHGNNRGIYLKHRRIQVHDNIIARNKRTGIAGSFSPGLRGIKNNILFANGPGGYYAPGRSPDEMIDRGNLILDPLLRDPRRGDFRLGAGSPARRAGAGKKDLGALPFRAHGRAPTRPKPEVIRDARSRRFRLKNPGGRWFLYLAPGTKRFTRRIALDGPELNLTGLPPGRTTRAAWSLVREGRESELSPVRFLRVPAHAPGLYQENQGAALYRGDWKLVRNKQARGGAYFESRRAGARMFFEFRGESLVLYRPLTPDGGEVDVLVDGRYRGRVSFRFREDRWAVPAVLDNLGPGKHRLELRVRPGGRVGVDAIQFPAPFRFSPEERHALERVNFHRRRAGIAPLLPAWSLQLAARSHSRYFLRNRGDKRLNGLGFHREYSGLPGFTGETAAARGVYFGYQGGAGEAGHFTGDPLWAVDGWVNTVYHRATVLDYDATMMGYGSVGDANYRVDTLKTGHGPARPRAFPGRRLIYTYPAHKQKEVPHDWDGAEVPDPLPGRDAQARKRPLGFPISLYIIHPREAESKSPWRVTKAELRDSRGRLAAIHVLDAKSDPNSVLRPGTVFLIPKRALKTGERYSAFVAGIDSMGAPFRRRWYFRTRGPGAITSMHAEPAACQALLRWRSAGKVKSYLEYAGPGQPFHRFFPPEGARDAFFARVYDLKPNTEYRWRAITITPGRNRVSMTRRFRTRAPRELRVPGQYDSIQKAFKAARACDVVRVASGTYQGPFRPPRGIVLRGENPPTTILKGDGRDSVLRMDYPGEVSGFTITGSGKDYWHAGIWIQDAPGVVVRGNRIRDNANGIVQYCFRAPCRAYSRIMNNTILRNSRRGIYIRSGAARILDNTVQAGSEKALDTAPGTSVTRRGNRISAGNKP